MFRTILSAIVAVVVSCTAHAQSVDPASISLTLEDGQMQTVDVSWSFAPLCIRSFEVDVVPSDPDVESENLTGILINGCGGDTSAFEVSFTGTGIAQSFDLQFVDAEFGGVLGTIPTKIAPAGAVGSIHGLKWLDRNGNGRRDRGELGLAGVTIYADLNGNGVLDRDEPATVSMRDDPVTDFDEAGRYWLEELKPSRYIIREVVSPEFAQTFPRDGRHHVAVQSGEAVEGIDFGNERLMPGSLHGLKWRDVNGNARRDRDEPGLPGVVIYIDLNGNGQIDADEPRTRTMADDPDTAVDESGRYWLSDLDAGRYVVREVVPDGFVQTFPPCDGSHVVILTDGAAVDGLDFGNQPPPPPGSIHGTKWRDTNGNARRDSDEPGLPGVTIYLDLNSNGELDGDEPVTVTMRDNPNTSVDESGHYWLRVRGPGTYAVREVVPDGFLQTFPRDGVGHRVLLEADDVVEGIDFGNWRVPPVSVHGTKWLDTNADGRRDADEPGLPGVTIYADLNANGQLDRGEPHTLTMRDDPDTDFDESGLYWLEVDGSAKQIIREVVPDGFRQTFPDGDGSHVVVTENGGAVDGVDFGNQRHRRCDVDLNASVDMSDIRLILAARNEAARPGDPRDVNADGLVNVLDARICLLECDRRFCRPVPQ